MIREISLVKSKTKREGKKKKRNRCYNFSQGFMEQERLVLHPQGLVVGSKPLGGLKRLEICGYLVDQDTRTNHFKV